ncbi:MAG: hypothetical protein KAR00_02585 [Candidatus Pacebacteria bacterium]|nr:hypothetical protein [Candidatus Paceibacterota bacterium]
MENYRKRFIVLGTGTSVGIAIIKTLASRCGVLFACFRSIQEFRKQKKCLKLLEKYKSIRVCIIPDDGDQTFLRYLGNLRRYSVVVEGVICMSDWKPDRLFQSIRPLLRDKGRFIAVGKPMMLLPEDVIAKERGITTYSFSNANAPILIENVL